MRRPLRIYYPKPQRLTQTMKLRNIAISLLAAAGLMTSCITEDTSDCYNIYYLALSYLGDEQKEIFPEKIDRVDMYVFDENNNCVTSTRLSESEVEAQLTMLPPLEAGDYRIVCVGNAYDTEVTALDSKDLAKVSFASADYLKGETASGNDPLYWSAIDYTIAPYSEYKQEETKTTYFASSHYDITVDVLGVPSNEAKAAGVYPVIALEAVAPYTDFNNRAYGEPTTYVMETAHDGQTTLKGANNIMRHTNHQDVWMRVYTSDMQTVLAEVNFAEFLEQNSLYIDTTLNEVLIPFQVKFRSSQVEITVPDWMVENVDPDFGKNN